MGKSLVSCFLLTHGVDSVESNAALVARDRALFRPSRCAYLFVYLLKYSQLSNEHAIQCSQKQN